MRPAAAALAFTGLPSTAPRRNEAPRPWWEKRTLMRAIVGGCPDHWWKPTARRTAACTCPAY